MRRLLLGSAFLGLAPIVPAQDLIVTMSGDSIRCVITMVTPDRLFYTVTLEDHTQRDDIATGNVAMYKRAGYFPVILGDVGERRTEGPPPGEHGWMLTATMGFSHRTAPLPSGIGDAEADYINGLRGGLHASGALHYFVSEEVAIGLEYNSFFGAKNSLPITVLLQDSTTLNGLMADDIRLRYLGFDVLFRPIALKSLSPFGSIGVGRLVYEDRATFINNFTITGSSIAFNIRAGLEFRSAGKLSMATSLAYFVCSLNRFEVDTGSAQVGFTLPDNAQENVSRLDLGVLMRLRL
jgi:hypothetical protein